MGSAGAASPGIASASPQPATAERLSSDGKPTGAQGRLRPEHRIGAAGVVCRLPGTQAVSFRRRTHSGVAPERDGVCRRDSDERTLPCGKFVSVLICHRSRAELFEVVGGLLGEPFSTGL